ncbi:MAG TPA: hypothetical protein VIF43_00790 [Patescibacteria group bacterium]|jgi:plastocyanin
MALSVVALVIVAGVVAYLLSQNRSETAVVETGAPTAAPTGSASPEASDIVTVRVGADGFEPDRITVKSGEEIVFVASSEFEVASEPHPVHTSNSELNMPPLQAGQTARATVTKKGTFGIHNHNDSSQKATVVVE